MKDSFYASPPSYDSYVAKLSVLKQRYPFLDIRVAGKSAAGRNVFSIGIGSTRQVSLFAGAFHAQEWLTTSLLVAFLQDLSESYQNRTTLGGQDIYQSFQTKGLLLVPMVNPDGVEIALSGPETAGSCSNAVAAIMETAIRSWQANARGVDLNHNYDAGFCELQILERQCGITGPAPRQYGGPYAHSEPETKTMLRILQSHNVDTAFAFHSQGEEIFYEYGENTPARSYYLAKLLSELSGYTLVQNDGLYSHGGFKDYFIEKYKRPGFTIEIGLGENPLPITDLWPIYRKLLSMMVAAAIV